MAAVADDREQQLAWEARQRPRAGIAAIVAAVFLLAGFLWWVTLLRDSPQRRLPGVARPARADGPIGEQPSIQIDGDAVHGRQRARLHRLRRCCAALAPVALAYAVTFLAVATRARRPEFPRAAVYMTIVGAVLYCLGTAGAEIERAIAFNSFLDGPRTVDDARDVISTRDHHARAARLRRRSSCVAAGMLLVSLNAMRVGLLTRFLGILGMVAGVVSVFPQLMPVPLVQAFWLVALGLHADSGAPAVPPAWRTGNAEPWPSAKDGGAAAAGGRGAPSGHRSPSPSAEPAPAAQPHPSSKKRKRKRRG